MAHFGISVTYNGKRRIWAVNPGNKYFGDYLKRDAERLAKLMNEAVKDGHSVFKKPINARAVKVEHGKVYPTVAKLNHSNRLICENIRHAG
jgi:predicted AAA+ superfamily ATPase